jgi:chemotaxis protein CheZ
MPIRRKVFRIEELSFAGRASAAAQRIHDQRDHPSDAGARQAMSQTSVAAIGASGLRQLKDETDTIHRAIVRTKQEIATLHASGFSNMEHGRVVRELDAVAGGTERATHQILAAAEEIDEAANNLSALLKHGQEQALAHDIRDQVIRIFEACNFQDLAGQRITTVMATLKFVEDHVTRMMEIWGGIEAFKDYAPAPAAERAALASEASGQRGYSISARAGHSLEAGSSARASETVAANGPKLEGDTGHATQAEIDALFSERMASGE